MSDTVSENPGSIAASPGERGADPGPQRPIDTVGEEFFDRGRIAAGRGSGRRRRTLLFLVESWADGADAGAVVDFLAGTEVFGALDRAVLRDLLPHLEPVHVGAGEVVLAPDSLYLVGHGRIATAADGERGPGQVVGAAALLGGGSAAGGWARGLRDSLLLRLSAASFEAFADLHPQALLGLCRELLRSATAPAAPAAARTVGTIAVVPAGPGRPPADLVAGLAAALGGYGTTLVLTAAAVDAALGPGSAQIPPQDPRNGTVVGWLQRAEQQHRFVVYAADPDDTAWTRRCVRQADRVLLVAAAGPDPRPGPAERALDGVPARRDLVLVHPPGTTRPAGTGRWLAGRGVELHHHVRAGCAPDLRRVARHLAGRACGLVLGGGGMRGFAHLGVLAALDEAGVEVDVVGGTSIGAIMAGFAAAELDRAGRLHAATRAMVDQGSMVPATLPLVSWSSGRKVTRLLRAEPAFDTCIEDLWRPFFCVSASLGRVAEVVHERGPVWRAVRSSISLPGVYPPVPDGADLLVDGGVINNLPVDVMAERVRPGPVIAVDLQPDVDAAPPAPFGESLSGWRVLAARMRGRAAGGGYPRLPDVLLRSLTLSNSQAQRERLRRRPVALHLCPPVGDGGLLDFRAGPDLIEPARRYTLEMLDRHPLPARDPR